MRFPRETHNGFLARSAEGPPCLSREALKTPNTPRTEVLWLGLPCERRLSVGGLLRCRPLPQAVFVASAR